MSEPLSLKAFSCFGRKIAPQTRTGRSPGAFLLSKSSYVVIIAHSSISAELEANAEREASADSAFNFGKFEEF